MQKTYWCWLQGMSDLCLVTEILTEQPGYRALKSGRIQPNSYTGVSFDGRTWFLDLCICFVLFHLANPSSPGLVIEMLPCKAQNGLMLWCKKFSLIHWVSLSSGPAGIWKDDRSWLCLLLGQRELSHWLALQWLNFCCHQETHTQSKGANLEVTEIQLMLTQAINQIKLEKLSF